MPIAFEAQRGQIADVLRKAGYRPQIIVGDPEQISTDTLKCGAHVVLPADADGHARWSLQGRRDMLLALNWLIKAVDPDILMGCAQWCFDAPLLATVRQPPIRPGNAQQAGRRARHRPDLSALHSHDRRGVRVKVYELL